MTNKTKETINDVVMGVGIFIASLMLIYLSAIVSSCSTTRETNINGKATIVTIDTTHITHKGVIKYPK